MWLPAGAQNYGEVWEGFLEEVSPGSKEAFPKVRMAGTRAQGGRESHVTFERHQETEWLMLKRKCNGVRFGIVLQAKANVQILSCASSLERGK